MKQNRWQDPGIHSWWIPGYFYKKKSRKEEVEEKMERKEDKGK